MAEISWTLEAQSWLKDIYDYIAADNAEAGYKYESPTSRPVRILLYGHYRITYLVKANEDIDIIGVFHGALDIDRYLV